jgi:hypothetical protein
VATGFPFTATLNRLAFHTLLLVLFALGGCTSAPVTVPVILEPVTEVSKVHKPAPEKVRTAKPASVPAQEPIGPLTILQSSNSPTYSDVADAIDHHAPVPARRIVMDVAFSREAFLQEMADSNTHTVIALGDQAMNALRNSGLQVIHAQTLMANEGARGVPALPAASTQLRFWLQHFPEALRVGVITSASMRPVVQSLIDASAAAGVTVVSREVTSDKAYWFEFRTLIPAMDAFFFLPDESVLSPDVIQNVLSHGAQNGIRFLVFSPVMQKLGADLLLTQEADDIALALLELVQRPELAIRQTDAINVSTAVSRRRVIIDG